MKKNITVIISLAGLIVMSCAHAEGMCKGREAEIFTCEMERSISSLCESKDTGAFFYRNGFVNKINLDVSENGVRKGRIFYFSRALYSGGGEAHIRFSRAGYTYYLYDKTIKTDGGPTFSAGIVIYRGATEISNHVCLNNASIHRNAYSDIPKENYRSIDSK
ncbi:hypothetical protein [Burkholderia sp. WAC0059]|uniref:hypothetical protein n=1 Tax=Burkholderia sp. WAC0059 TaxID=2066022 RepID=UPI0011AFBFC6|nr:hypothetical protein [Burkholderia sp. WAC0059]